MDGLHGRKAKLYKIVEKRFFAFLWHDKNVDSNLAWPPTSLLNFFIFHFQLPLHHEPIELSQQQLPRQQ